MTSMSIEVIDMKKQRTEKAKPQARATVRMDRDVWTAARHAALDKGISFGRLVEDALRAYLGVKS
jgi:predicted HicB family RNase H-like nuclease